MIGFVNNHWNGRLALVTSVALPLVGLHVGVVVILAHLGLAPGHFALGVGAAILALLVWQVVGVFRAVDRTIIERGGIMPGFAGYLAITIVVLSTVYQLAGLAIPEWPGIVRPETRAVEVRVDAARREFVLDGPISLRGFSVLERLIRDNPSIRAIALRSQGGSVSAARGMARLVEDAGLETRVAGTCFSACTLVFLAGEPRRLLAGGVLGFHRYAVGTYQNLGGVVLLDVEKEHARDRAYFWRRGVSDAFLDHVFETEPSAIWRPSRNELLAAGVLRD